MAFPDYPDNNDFIDVVDESFPKKKKDKSTKYITFENALEGYILEPVDVSDVSKGHLNWSRVGKQPLKFSNAKLAEISRKLRVEKRLGPMTVFNALSADQRGVIDRLIEDCQNREKDKNAVWVLEGVRKYNKAVRKNWAHSLIFCNKIMIILKRQEKHAGRDGRVPYKPNTFQANEIIDLSVPAKKKGKKNKKIDDDDEWEQNVADNAMFEGFGHGPGPGRHDAHDHRAHETGPFPDVPHGAIPIPVDWPQQPPPPQAPGVYPNNPFNAAFEPPRFDQHCEPAIGARVLAPMPPLRHDPRDHRSESRSRSRRRREDERRRDQHEREMEDIRREKEDLFDRMERFNIRDTSPSEESYRAEAYWSGGSGGTITPPSSVSDYVGGHRKGYRREGYALRDRSRRAYRDGPAMLEPYSSTDRRRQREDLERVPGGILRYPSLSSPRRKQALIHQDDYPVNPVRRALPQEPGEGYYPADFSDRRRRSRGREGERVLRGDQRDFGRRDRPWPN